MKIKILIICLLILAGCASAPVVKPDLREVPRFVTFKSEPIGADIFVVDLNTGKEVSTFGKTPVRIMIFKNSIETDSITKVSIAKNFVSNAQGFIYGSKAPEGVEFQFKFKMAGYYDELKVLRIPLLSASETELPVAVKLQPISK